MRFLVQMHWWYKGDMDRCKAAVDKDRENGTRTLDTVEQRMAEFSQSAEEIIDAETPEEAVFLCQKMHRVDMPRVDKQMSYFRAYGLPYVTLRELLTAPVAYTRHSVYGLDDFINDDNTNYQIFFHADANDKIEAEQRIRTDYIVDHCFDGRRCQTMAIVKFDGEPVFVYQRAGREGDDHKQMWIISKPRLKQMRDYVRTFFPEPDNQEETPLDKEMPEISIFYGNSIADLPRD
jgi:hypothetical protein